MRISYTYRSFPNCPAATEYSRQREASNVYLLALVLIGGFLAALVYIASTSLFPTEMDWKFLCLGFGAVIIWGLFAFYTFVRRPLATELNLKIILDEEHVVSLPYDLREDDYAKLRKDVNKKVLEAAKPACVYFFYGLGFATTVIWDIVFIKKGYIATTIIYLLAALSLAAGALYYHSIRKKTREKAELYKALHKSIIKNDDSLKPKNDENWVCPQCGSKNKIHAMFCKDCGTYK